MTTYTIDTENNITAFANKREAEGETFSTQRELTDVAATWSAARLADWPWMRKRASGFSVNAGFCPLALLES